MTTGSRPVAAPTGIIRFNTDSHAPRERLEAFQVRINTMFDMVTPEGGELDFSGEIVSTHTGSMLISAMRTQHFDFSRTRRRILIDHLDHIMLRVDLDAPWSGGGRPVAITLIDLGQPSETNSTPEHNISLVVPRRSVYEYDLLAEYLHGQPLTSPSAMFLADHITSLMRHANGLGPELVARLTDVTPGLIASCLAPSRESFSRAQRETELLIIERARTLIRENLYNSRLTPSFVQAHLGVSRATLYRLFEPFGGVASAIRQGRIRQALADIHRMQPGDRLADIGHALGFSSEAHFSRSFRAHYGCSPRDARGLIGEVRGTENTIARHDAERLFPEWLQAL